MGDKVEDRFGMVRRPWIYLALALGDVRMGPLEHFGALCRRPAVVVPSSCGRSPLML